MRSDIYTKPFDEWLAEIRRDDPGIARVIEDYIAHGPSPRYWPRCPTCGAKINPEERGAIYCSDACRMRSHA